MIIFNFLQLEMCLIIIHRIGNTHILYLFIQYLQDWIDPQILSQFDV